MSAGSRTRQHHGLAQAQVTAKARNPLGVLRPLAAIAAGAAAPFVRVALSHRLAARYVDQNCSSSSSNRPQIDAMNRRANGAASWRPRSALPKTASWSWTAAGYVSTQVDVLSPKHDERYTEGEAIPLGLEVQAWPVDIAARRDVRLCVVLDELEPACIPVQTSPCRLYKI